MCMVALKCCIQIVRLHELYSFAYTHLAIDMQCLQPVHVMWLLAGPQGTVLLCVLSMRSIPKFSAMLSHSQQVAP